MKQFGISYVKKDNHKTSVEGWSLYTKRMKGWSEEHIEQKCKIPNEHIRSIWEIDNKGFSIQEKKIADNYLLKKESK